MVNCIQHLLPSLPKAELHLHLRGAVPPSTLAELLNRRDVRAALATAPERVQSAFAGYDNLRPFLCGRRDWSPEEVAALFTYRDFDNFLYTFFFTSFVFHTADDLRLLIRGVLDDLARQHVVYAELCISAYEYVARGIPLPGVVACLEEATHHPRVRVQWIVDLVRNVGPEVARQELDGVLALNSSAVVGVTLGGSEDCFPHDAFRDVYARARDHGLRLSVHAGETLGPESVWQALEALRPDRIGHGVRAAEDPALVAHLVQRRIPLEVCPTSNVLTGAYPSYEAHPAKSLFAAGIPITINSDDPTFFHTTLTNEYTHLPALGFTDQDLLPLLRNSFRCAFLPESDIARYLRQLDTAWQAATTRTPE